MLHPHHYTLSLLKHVLNKSEHTLFPEQRLAQMKKEYEALTVDHTASLEDIELAIGRFGREIWPYHEALEELYRRHGKALEEKRVKEKLSPQTKAKYEQFLDSGGGLADFRRGSDLEVYFTPEEKYEIGQAVVETNHTTLQEIASSCRVDRKNECEEVIEDHKQKLARLEKKLSALRRIAEQSEHWKPEILDRVKTFEQSFGYLTRTFHETDLDGAIDYYQGVIELEGGAVE